MKLTQRQRLMMALESRGSTRIHSGKRRYIVLTIHSDPHAFFYLGKSGSLRRGRTYTSSRPCADWFKAELLAQVPATIAKSCELN